jgi:uncharacterized protein with HEPN domain
MKNTENRELLFLHQIKDSIEKIETFLEGCSLEVFLHTQEKQSAVIMQLLVIGEITKKLSEETKQRGQHTPWKQIAGLRDVIAHHYFSLEPEQIWKTAKNKIPLLKKEILLILAEETT